LLLEGYNFTAACPISPLHWLPVHYAGSDFALLLECQDFNGMKTFRIVLGVLALIPLALLADKILFHAAEYDEDSLRTLAFLVLGIPILILNLWAWVYPISNKKDEDKE